MRPELLAPVGNPEKLHTALLYGADAVYLGGDSFNLRAGCDGFSPEELRRAVRLAEQYNARVYFTLNALPMQRDMAGIPSVIETAVGAGVHAFIIADPGIFRLVRRYAPHMDIHLSTQVNTTNAEAAAFWADLGVSRINLARELTCRDIYAVRKSMPDMEFEVFVHGAMCLAVSGQCLLSAWLNNRPANLGRCTHPCRFAYKTLGIGASPKGCSACLGPDNALTVSEQTRRNEPVWTVHEGERYSSFWAPLDLCLLEYLPWFVHTGIRSLKVEGRMKGPSYVAHVIDAYRTALDLAARNGSRGNHGNHGNCGNCGAHGDPGGHGSRSFDPAPYIAELMHTASRPLATGFFLPDTRKEVSAAYADRFTPQPLLAKVEERLGDTAWRIAVRGSWQADTPVRLMLPGMRRPVLEAGEYRLENHRGERAAAVHSGVSATLHTEYPDILPGIFLRQA